MTSSTWQRFMQGDSCPECGCPIMELNDDDGNREGLCCTQCDWMQFDNPAEPSGASEHKRQFEVKVKGGGDLEIFLAHEVEIVVNGREHFVITPGNSFGLAIQSPNALCPVSVDRDTVMVYETYD